jgi:hypothetical protein
MEDINGMHKGNDCIFFEIGQKIPFLRMIWLMCPFFGWWVDRCIYSYLLFESTIKKSGQKRLKLYDFCGF